MQGEIHFPRTVPFTVPPWYNVYDKRPVNTSKRLVKNYTKINKFISITVL